MIRIQAKSVLKFGRYLISLQKYVKGVIAVEFQYLVKEIGSLCEKTECPLSQSFVILLCLQIFASASCICFHSSESLNPNWEHRKEIISKQPEKFELSQSFKKPFGFDIVQQKVNFVLPPSISRKHFG